jgi:hypothetical protein
VGAVSCRREMGEDTLRRARMEPPSRIRWSVWTASSPESGLKWVWRGLVEFSTMSNGSTPDICNAFVRCHAVSLRRNRRESDYPQEDQRDKQTRSTTFAVVENATHYFSLLVQAWLFHLASEARSSTPTFPENHLIERLAPGWFWSGSLLTAGERRAKGDRDSKVKVLGNTQDRPGLLRLPHRGDA